MIVGAVVVAAVLVCACSVILLRRRVTCVAGSSVLVLVDRLRYQLVP
jgi:uncharacterized MnhB-related membrane protein